MAKIGSVTGPGSMAVPVVVDFQELRQQLTKAGHPLSNSPEWNGQAIYMALIYEPVMVCTKAAPDGALSEKVTRIVHVLAPRSWGTGLSPSCIQDVRDCVRAQDREIKVPDESIVVTQLLSFPNRRLVSDIKVRK